MVARCGYMVNKWTVTAVAALALMAVVLATALPAWAQNGNGLERDYPENGADPVATFTSVDPEGRTVYWSLPNAVQTPMPEGFVGTDFTNSNAAHFSISMDGVLTFKSPPDYENSMGGGTDGTDTTSPTYNIVVASSDDTRGATTDGETPKTDGSNLPKMAYHKVTVTVTDEDEDGSVSLSALQPQASVAFTAALKDDDASDAQITNAKWKWEQSSAMDGPWTIISGATMAEYMPAMDVAGMYLRVTATYTDEHGDDKTAMAVTAHMVRATPSGGNAAPVFPDTDASPGADEQSRTVKENLPKGTAVGKPVTAGDAGDVLTYTLTGDNAGGYQIDRATGQIMVGTVPNRESLSDPWQHTVTVRGYRPVRRPQRCG